MEFDVDNLTCIWSEGCDLPRHGCGLCKRHWQRAKRGGTLDDYRTEVSASQVCLHCGGHVGEGRRSRAAYCSKRCYNAAYKINGCARPSVERQREYARASYKRTRAAKLAELGPRACAECGAELPASARLSRIYCSQACKNRAAIREKPEQRREANRRRRALILAAHSPGVVEKDWQRTLARHGGKCAYCGSGERITMDHVVPIAKGGWHAIGNVLPACFPCNASKRDDLLIAWLNGRGTARLKPAL